MKKMPKESSAKRTATVIDDQVSANVVDLQNMVAESAKQRGLQKALETLNENQESAFDRFTRAMAEMDKARETFSKPENMLGPDRTKHGEAAETIAVTFRNADNIMEGKAPDARLMNEGAERISETDYTFGDTPVQSKYINGGKGAEVTPNNSLRHVIEHMKTYEDYAIDCTKYGHPGHRGIYVIPKEQYEMMMRIKNGDLEGLHWKQIEATRKYIKTIEEKAGRPIEEVVFAGPVGYDEVQLGKVNDTLDRKGEEINTKHEEQKRENREEYKKDKEKAEQLTDPSWSKAFKAAGISAGISGATSAGIKLYFKVKEKKLKDFTEDDWKEVGVEFGKGAAKGGVSGLCIYGLSNMTPLSKVKWGSQSSAAFVTATMGVTSLWVDYKRGFISKEDLKTGSKALCLEAAVSGAFAGLGNVFIPGIGGAIGSSLGTSVIKIFKEFKGTEDIVKELSEELKELKESLDAETKEYIKRIDDFYSNISFLIKNTEKTGKEGVDASVQLCFMFNVQDEVILKESSDLDDFINS